jgi:hypothetical protein
MTLRHRRLALLALLAALLGGCRRAGQEAPLAAPPPQVEVSTLPLPPGDDDAVGVAPEPRWLLHHGDEMALSEAQTARVAAAEAAYEKATVEDRAAQEKASADFVDFLRAGKDKGSVDSAEVERRNQAAAACDARLRSARRAAWDALWAMLSEAQRAKVRALRQEHPMELR